MADVDTTLTRRRDEPDRETVDRDEIDTVMRRFLARSRQDDVVLRQVIGTGADIRMAQPRRDVDMACDILDRASQAFDLLLDRCQRLERDLDVADERSRAQAAEQVQTIDRWKRLASGLKSQVDASDQAATALKARCDAAEARAALAEARVSTLERASAQAASQAALAEQLSTKLHDKVVSAFGIGSRAHPVLEAVATQVAAE